ncbi:unnamed protein product, partial [Rotaria sordida]
QTLNSVQHKFKISICNTSCVQA